MMDQPQDEARPRIRMTAQLFREILDSVKDDIETLGMEEVMTEGEDMPDELECAAIKRAEGMLQSCADALLREVQVLESRQLDPKLTAESLVIDDAPFDEEKHTDGEKADHDAGLKAGLEGEPNDDTKSSIWQRGWADAQE
jgi:hypothetical protein